MNLRGRFLWLPIKFYFLSWGEDWSRGSHLTQLSLRKKGTKHFIQQIMNEEISSGFWICLNSPHISSGPQQPS